MNWKAFIAPYRMIWRQWWHEALPSLIAYALPRKVVYFAAFRVHGEAMYSTYQTRTPEEISFFESVDAWEHG